VSQIKLVPEESTLPTCTEDIYWDSIVLAVVNHNTDPRIYHAIDDKQLKIVKKAYDLAKLKHGVQLRLSGDPYISHPVAVANKCIELGLDHITVVSALLHDLLEDTKTTLEEIESQFGSNVATIVDGLTKLERIKFESKFLQQSASIRKMIVAIAKDWRVIVIKLADRLHNMETISVMPEWKQRRIAQETIDIYSPLAHRLGMAELKAQLEDLSFKVLHPNRYAEIQQMVEARLPKREEYLNSVISEINEKLTVASIDAEVTGRPKHFWSIYEKMVVKGLSFDEINDLYGIRIITKNERACWSALGVIHSVYNPIPGRFKDYINSPKFNLYQSLHTTLIGKSGKMIEVQIRSWEMHWRAERGIAAHWGYKQLEYKNNRSTKQLKETPKAIQDEMAWLQRIVDMDKDTPDPVEFLESLKLDLEEDEVFVFTPKGKVVNLPANSTPIDFAYSIHTEVGHRCIGAKVNSKLVPLDFKLVSGQSVEIITSKAVNAGPSRDWLKIAVSSRAKSKIRQWFLKEEREDAIDIGKEELLKAAKRAGVPIAKLSSQKIMQEVLSILNLNDLDSMYSLIGHNQLSEKTVIDKIQRELNEVEELETVSITVSTIKKDNRTTSGIYVEGLDDVLVRLSRCCMPVPGDPIIGFVTRGRGVSVHCTTCTNAISLAGMHLERLIEVEWDKDQTGVFSAIIEVKALDRPALLADVTKVMSDSHVNIISAKTSTSADRIAQLRFEFELADRMHLDSVLKALRRIDSVYSAYRVVSNNKAVAIGKDDWPKTINSKKSDDPTPENLIRSKS
jgi:GTP pyrophosphokinase